MMTNNRTYIRSVGSTNERDDIVRHAEIEGGSCSVSVLEGKETARRRARESLNDSSAVETLFSYFRPSLSLIIEIS